VADAALRGGRTERQRRGDRAHLSAADYLADAEGWDVRGIVHVDAGAVPEAALDETDWLQDMADARGMPNAIIGFAALDDPGVETLLKAHSQRHANVRGIRHIVNWHADPQRTYTPRDVTQDAAWQRGFALLGKYGLSFDLQAYPAQFTALPKLIERHPEVPVIINHCGMMVPGDPDGRSEWRAGMAALAACANVSVKVSGIGFAYRPWNLEQARGYVREAIDIFGTHRAMFASDVPTDKLFGSFDRHLQAYRTIVSDMTLEEQRALFAGNANRIYRLGIAL
jgi:predicted TIM-barrel fold metal-dependent hydrolase